MDDLEPGAEPSAAEPSADEPGTGLPGADPPGTNEPSANEPGAAEPSAAEPIGDGLAAETRSVLSEIEQELAAVSRALDRLESGRYGRCEVCDTALGEELLTEDPTAERCRVHR